MIINSLNNLKIYQNVYSHLSEAVQFIEKNTFEHLKEGRNDISDNFYIVKIKAEKNNAFDGILEIHKDWIDIHIPLNTNDVIAYKEISSCQSLEKEYDTENDYALYRTNDSRMVDISPNYFCIIDTTMAHMAMLGEGTIEKLVFKIKK